MKHARLGLIFLFLAGSGAVLAQTLAGMGGMSGVVRDPSGAVVPNANVVVENEAKGVRRTLETNAAGLFTVPALVPSQGYRVTVNARGFTPFERNEIEILVGQNIDLSVTLTLGSTTTQVEVFSAAPIVENTKTDVSQVIESQQIRDLPINGRRVDSFALAAPGVTNDGTFGLLSFRGVAGGNSFLQDGNDATEQYYNENAGRTRIASQISQDAVQEFQVLSSDYSAEYGRAVGGVINTVTQSGSNGLHGTMYWFFRNRTLNARDRYAAFNPPEIRHQAGVSVGGPLIKNKLFYFFNFDITRRDFPLSSSIVKPGTIDTSGHFIGCSTPATPAQCAAIDAILPRYFALIPRQANQELGFGKADWRPSERNSVSASFNILHFRSPSGIQTAAAITTGAAIGSNGDDSVRVQNGRVSWTGIATPNAVNEFRFGWFTDRQADDFNPKLIVPGGGLYSLTVAGQANLGGGANYLPRVQPNEQRFEYADNLTWTRGRHTMKFGFDILNSDDFVYQIFNQFGSYTYGSVTNFALDFSGNTAGSKSWQSYSQTFGLPSVDTTIKDFDFYAQDQFRVTPKLTINYGLRYEFTSIPQPKLINPDYPQTGTIPEAKLNFGPRIGVAYSLNDKTVIRAGYGIFHARYQAALIQNLIENNGLYQPTATLSAPADLPSGPVFPNILASSNLAKNGNTVMFAAPNLRMPYSEQGDLAVERQLAKDIGLTASYIWSRGAHLTAVRDLNVGPLGPNVTYSILDTANNVVGTYTTPTYLLANRVDKRYTRVTQVEGAANSYYDALVLQLRKRWSKGLFASVAYTWSHAIDDNQGGGSSNLFFSGAPSSVFNGDYNAEKGSSVLDQRHRLAISFIEQPTFLHRDGAVARYLVNNWQLSVLATLASTHPATATILVSGTPFTGAAFNGSLNGLGGSSRVPFYPVNSLDVDQTYRADARISKILPFNERFKLYLNFEAFNVTNTVSNTGIFTQAFTASGLKLTPTPGLGVGNASGGFPDGTNARRAQVSARFVF